MSNNVLLAQIQQGKRLKKAETNDRSAPAIDGSKPSGGGVARAGVASGPVPGGGGPPQLGAIFAGGIPKLKPAGQPPIGKPPSIPNRSGSGFSTPAPPTPSRSASPLPPATPARSAPPLPPATPARSAPFLPATPSRSAPPLPPARELLGRAVPAPPQPAAARLAPTPPRRPPPPARPLSPSSRPPALPARPVSPPPRPASSGPTTTPSRQIPKPLSSSQSLSLPARKVPPPPTTSGRAPPPPPPRPSVIKPGTTSVPPPQLPRAVPQPPSRTILQPHSEEETTPSLPARAVPPPPSRKNPQFYSEEEPAPSQPARAVPPPPRRNPQPNSEEEPAPSRAILRPPSRRIPPQTQEDEPAPPRVRSVSTGGSRVNPPFPGPQPNLEEETAPPPVIPRPPSRRIPQQTQEDEPTPPRTRSAPTAVPRINPPLPGPQPYSEETAPPRAIHRSPSRRIPQQTQEDEPALPRVRSASTGGSGFNPPLPGLSPSTSTLVPPVSRPPPAAPSGMRGATTGRRTASIGNMNGASRNGPKPVTSSRIPSPPPSSGPHTFPTSSDFPPPRTFTRSAKKYASGNVRGSRFNVPALG